MPMRIFQPAPPAPARGGDSATGRAAGQRVPAEGVVYGGPAVVATRGYRTIILDGGDRLDRAPQPGITPAPPRAPARATPGGQVAQLRQALGGLPAAQQVTAALGACRGDRLDGLWALLDLIGTAAAAQLPVYRQSLDQAAVTPAERACLQAACDTRAATLAGAEDGVLRISARSFGALVDYVARRRLGIEPEHAGHERELAQLSAAPRFLVERAAGHQALLAPSSDSSGPVMDAWRNWDRAAPIWEKAGLPMQTDAAVDRRLAWEQQQGVVLTDAFWARQTDLRPDQVEVWRQVKEGRRFSRQHAPAFLPQPQSDAMARTLAKGAALRPSVTVARHYAPLLEKLPGAGQPLSAVGLRAQLAGGDLPASTRQWPSSMRAILPDLLGLEPAERREALPWLLLQHLVDRFGEGSRREQGINLRRLEREARDDPGLVGLYVEWAEDYRPELNEARQVFGGALDNEALRCASRFAPRLARAFGDGWEASLPAVDAVVDAARAEGDGAPLAEVNLIGVQHLLLDNAATLSRLQQLGLDPRHAALVGVPYSTSELAVQRLREQGFDVDTRERRDLPYDAWREAQVCELVRKGLALHAQNGNPIVVMDDGGYVTKTLARHFPAQAHLFTVVEQTTRGITVAEQQRACEVISVARCSAKQLELPGVASAIGAAVRARLARYCADDFLPGKPAVVIGFGWIGGIVADTLRSMGRQVVVVDPSAEARARAAQEGYTAVAAPEEVLAEAAIIAGCSGKRSLTAAQLATLEYGPVLFSCSSSSVEMELPERSGFHEDLVVRGARGNYVALGSGFPINFTGAPEAGSPRYLQYTCAAMVEGVLQAAARRAAGVPRGAPAIVPLEAARSERIRTIARAQGNA